MSWVCSGARHGLRGCVLSLVVIATTITIASNAADARYYRRVRVYHRAAAEEYSPPYASIVVDGNNGAVLQASNPDAPRHPASLTKVMTLYLLFERLDAGKIKLDTLLQVSQHAADQDPTKLDLKPGQTISVEDAIKGVVTKSANDAAVVIAENLGGGESAFAKLMTQTAHALGMAHTTYVNASGLPDDDQLTTARDQALLGRAIQDRFPAYYKYFSTESFVYRGEAMRNHNHLLGAIEGVDGIKTGFTRASGFNLLTSVHRDGRYIVAVVLGGPSASDRDDRMRDLIGDHLKEASLHRTAPMIAEAALPPEEAQPVAVAKGPTVSTTSRADPTPTASVDAHVAAGNNDPIKPLLVKTITYRTAPVQTASLAPMPMLVPVAAPAHAPAIKPVEPPAQAAAPRADQLHALVAAADAATAPTAEAARPAAASPEPAKADPVAPSVPANRLPAATQVPAVQTPPPEPLAALPPAAKPIAVQAPAVQAPAIQPTASEKPSVPASMEAETTAPAAAPEMAYAEPAKVEPAVAEPAIASVAPVHAHGGWLIQIGAFDDEDQAKQHLSAAQLKVSATLKAADPFTERIQKGDKAMYRARFAGFDRATAEAACRQLKRSDFECMAVKD
jgi:D-alanyl-D-alanine carboxypeptidase